MHNVHTPSCPLHVPSQACVHAAHLALQGEDVMPDSSGLWIAAQGSCSRKFVDKASGYTVRTDRWTLL